MLSTLQCACGVLYESFLFYCVAEERRLLGYLGDDDSHCEVLGVSGNKTQHHYAGQTDITTRLSNVVNNCTYTSRIHY